MVSCVLISFLALFIFHFTREAASVPNPNAPFLVSLGPANDAAMELLLDCELRLLVASLELLGAERASDCPEVDGDCGTPPREKCLWREAPVWWAGAEDGSKDSGDDLRRLSVWRGKNGNSKRDSTISKRSWKWKRKPRLRLWFLQHETVNLPPSTDLS